MKTKVTRGGADRAACLACARILRDELARRSAGHRGGAVLVAAFLAFLTLLAVRLAAMTILSAFPQADVYTAWAVSLLLHGAAYVGVHLAMEGCAFAVRWRWWAGAVTVAVAALCGFLPLAVLRYSKAIASGQPPSTALVTAGVLLALEFFTIPVGAATAYAWIKAGLAKKTAIWAHNLVRHVQGVPSNALAAWNQKRAALESELEKVESNSGETETTTLWASELNTRLAAMEADRPDAHRDPAPPARDRVRTVRDTAPTGARNGKPAKGPAAERLSHSAVD